MIDIGTALASLKAAQSAAEKYADTPLKQALITAYDGILQTKEQALSMQEELHLARRRIMELEQQLSARTADPKEGLTFDRQAYWGSENREHGPDGPFCMHCLDRGTGRRRLIPAGHMASCAECKKGFAIWPEKHRPQSPPRRGGINSVW